MESQPSPGASPSSQYQNPRPYGPQLKMGIQQTSQHSDSDRSTTELRALDCNLTSLCDHIQVDGFNNGSFSDVVIHAMGSAYHLHRLIISRSSYFRNMLHGPWKEANSPSVNLHIDDKNVNSEAIAVALAYLYGHHPKLSDDNAFRVLAAASFLDLQDLCAICTDFIMSELWISNFLTYQVFAESQDYGIHGERVRNACWGFLCQSGSMELKEVVPRLSSQTCFALLTSDELWVPSEEKRFELALQTFLAKGAGCKAEDPEQGSSSAESGTVARCDSVVPKGKSICNSYTDKTLEDELGRLSLKGDLKDHVQGLLVELVGSGVDFRSETSESNPLVQQASRQNLVSRSPNITEGPSSFSSPLDTIGSRGSCSCADMPIEGPSEEGLCCHLDNNGWLLRDQRNCFSLNSSYNGFLPNDWGRYGMPLMSWGGRVVGRRQLKVGPKEDPGVTREEYDAFVNIFEGGSLLYCNMSFEALLNARKRLEERGFPCKAVNDGLWLQMLLSQRVQEIAADTCKNCCLTSNACTCRQSIRFAHGVTSTGYYMLENDQNISPGNMGNMYVAEPSQGEGSGPFRPVRVHVRGPIDGLAGIGRGATFVSAPAGPPTRFVFSRVPFGVGNRNYPQSLANDDSDGRTDHNGDLTGDGLTALVGLSQGGSNSASSLQVGETGRAYEMDLQSRIPGTAAGGPSTGGIPIHMLESTEHTVGIEWENVNSSSISLDMKTPLSHFPPFRFGVQFEDVHRLIDGQVKHSPEVFYAGSLWKVSVQAFNDEDPQGRRTLGLFLHRRKAEINDFLRKAHVYVDTREKVTARYQLICPSKKEVMVFGSFKQTGTLLPKAPKGWGWRSALLFDELPDLLQNGTLRIAAVVQLV